MGNLIWAQTATGRLPRVNEWHAVARGRIINGSRYRRDVEDLIMQFRHCAPADPIERRVDLYLEVSTWDRLDSDATVKGTLDAIEVAGVLANDRLVRDILIRRLYHKRDLHDRCAVEIYEPGDERWSPGC